MNFHSKKAIVEVLKRRDEKPKTEYRLLAIDTGEKRMGFAIWDPRSQLIRSLPQYQRRGLKNDLLALQKIVEQEGVEALVVGIPQNEGRPSSSESAALFWEKKLRAQFDLPVWSCDESMSSRQAEEILRGQSPKRKKKKKDSLAAALFLEAFIRDQKNEL